MKENKIQVEKFAKVRNIICWRCKEEYQVKTKYTSECPYCEAEN
jgi:ribosomal protein L37E